MTTIAEVMGLAPVIPVLTITDVEHAVPLAEALVAGGTPALEVTLRSQAALPAIRRIAEAVPGACIGVGTLNTAAQVAEAVAAGARFGVSPGIRPAIVEAAAEAGLPLLPGVMTASEILAALELGIRALKLFPATVAGGVAALKAFGGPFPDVVFCPTGGVTKQTAPEYLALANVACVGGSWLAPPDLQAAGRAGTRSAPAQPALPPCS